MSEKIITYQELQDDFKMVMGSYLDGSKKCNQALYALCAKWANLINARYKELNKELSQKVSSDLTPSEEDMLEKIKVMPLLTNEERVEAVAKTLDYKVLHNQLGPSDLREYKDLFNLRAKDIDINIQMADFRGIYADLDEITAAVNWQIQHVNSEDD